MPRFYFHVRDGQTVYRDSEGIVLPDLGEAWMKALEDAKILASTGVLDAPMRNQWVEIGDDLSTVIASLPVAYARAH